MEYFPATHGVHGAGPVPTLYVPAAHVEHMPSGPVYPALHGGKIQAVLDVLEAGDVMPAGQVRHVVATVAARFEEYVPGPQSVHATEPVALLYFPVAHAEHMPSGPVYPALHGGKMHAALAVLAAGEFVPTRQPTHVVTAVAPVVAEYVPAAQSVHVALPVTILYLPAEHGEHMPSEPVYPALHGGNMQAALDVLETGEILPVGHLRHVN